MTLHDIVKTGDPDASRAICDANGEVVLSYCRRCKRGEGELVDATCTAPEAWEFRPEPGTIEFAINRALSEYDERIARAWLELKHVHKQGLVDRIRLELGWRTLAETAACLDRRNLDLRVCPCRFQWWQMVDGPKNHIATCMEKP